jgi:hypothetical protein
MGPEISVTVVTTVVLGRFVHVLVDVSVVLVVSLELVDDSVVLVVVDVTSLDTVVVVVAEVGTTVTTVCSTIGSILNPKSICHHCLRRPLHVL